MKRILLVEPICRGSRTQILVNTVESLLEEGNRVILLLRKDYKTQHFMDLFSPHLDKVEIISSNIDLNGNWIRNLTVREMFNYFYIINQNRHKFDEIIFMALDDYLLSFNLLLIYLKSRLKDKRVNIIKYRVQYLLTSNSLKQKILKFLTYLPVIILNAKLICFDERLANSTVNKQKINVLPDPWFGEFKEVSKNEKIILREKYKITNDKNVTLIIGRQTERKGIEFILNNIGLIFGDNKNLLLVVGKIDKEYSVAFNNLKKNYPEQIIHIDDFISETELPEVFQISDSILLPYSLTFDSSSGVLVRACATGKPVIATSHGLVGYRVSKNNLGETFTYNDSQSFLTAFNKLNAHKDSYYSFLRNFSKETSLESFKSKMKFILKVRGK